MKFFKYKAKNRSGKVVKGKVDAPTERIGRKYLEGKQLQVLEMTEYHSLYKQLNEIEIGKVVKDNDVIFFLSQLRSLMKSGMRISESLLLISNQTSNKKFRKILYSVYFEVENGYPLSKSLEKHKEFPKMLVKMLSIGEQTGNLLEVLDETKEYFEKQKRMTKALFKTLKMPIIYLSLAFVVMVAMLVFIFPVYNNVLENNSGKVNGLTTFFQGMSNFLTEKVITFTNPNGYSSFYMRINGLITIDSSAINVYDVNWFNLGMFVFVLTGLIVGYIYVKKTVKYQRFMSHVSLRMPIFGKILKLKYTSIMSSSIAQLLRNRVDMILALEITKDILPNYVYKDLLDKAIICVSSGESLSSPFEGHWAVEEVVPRMISIGEASNNVETMLVNLAAYYNENIEDRFDSLKEKVAPIITLFIYVLMGLLLVAMMLPTFYAIDGF